MPLVFQSSQNPDLDPPASPPGPDPIKPAGTSALAAAAILIGLVTCLFAAQRARVFSSTLTTRNHSVATAAPSSAPAVNPRRVFSGPMTDSDAERLRSLPPQAQAEELLARALAHDERAREIFDDNIREWTGHLRMTPLMRQLETRARFSSDLRVRYADADLNLALEGWARNESSAGTLLSRAQAEPKFRSYAVYYLGMLAGRGVDYDRIHAALLDYAQHDPDPIVRQWAVEGMRYLGKEEVLDDLFQSFTHDPSFSVRDRAGCNVSDCGNFTRAQRMRMVPQLIEVLGDTAAVPQMRNWSFLALQEITGESLPVDASVWANWYRARGAEKVAQLRSLPWWQIRGDE
jgi:HEAT repeat protein